MKRFILAVAFAVSALVVSGQMGADDKTKADEKKGGVVTALPPHPLDEAFERGRTLKDIDEGLLNNEHYAKAVKESLKAKQAVEKQRRENPRIAGPTPAQAARQKFLEVLLNEKKEPAEKN